MFVYLNLSEKTCWFLLITAANGINRYFLSINSQLGQKVLSKLLKQLERFDITYLITLQQLETF